jgi:hypothetical protein
VGPGIAYRDDGSRSAVLPLPGIVGPPDVELNCYGEFVTRFIDDRPIRRKNVISGICRHAFSRSAAVIGETPTDLLVRVSLPIPWH